jgi:Carboxypeptidase regulatory-like domain
MTTTCARKRCIPLVVLMLFASVPAAAQSIRAVVRDAVTGAPIPEAMVRVETANGSLVAADFADAAGVVVVRVPQPGSYLVEARRGGYYDAAVQVAAGGDQVQAVLPMAQRPFGLDTVVVIGRRPGEREREGFERRRAMGEGVFLDSAFLATRSGRVAYVGDMVAGVPGVYTRRGRGITVVRSLRGWRCMVMLLDGRIVEFGFRDGGVRELHQMVGPRDIKGVEIYREYSEVPPEFQRYAHVGMYRCGIYAYWTRARW